jgi:hypothetical protein
MCWKNFIGFLFLIGCIHSVSAQERGTVQVTKDPQIDSLIAKRLALSKDNRSGSNIEVSGFRVQIFSGLERQQAYAEQAKFKERFPV